jgi:hypothetical protein
MMTSMLVMMLLGGGFQETPGAAAEAPAAASERRVCRVVDRTGSILPRRVCRPASYWAAIDAEQSRITERDNQHVRDHARTSMREF